MNDRDDEITKKKKRTIVAGNLMIVTIVIFLLGCLSILLVNAYNSSLTRNQVTDCVEPGGECFREGQERTKKVVEKLIEDNNLSEVATRRVVILASVCAEHPEVRSEINKVKRIRLMEECINSELSDSKKQYLP